MADDPREKLSTLYGRTRLALESLAESGAAPDGDYLHPVFGEGNASAQLLLIGEAPGADEAAAGRPFVGKAGRQLDELLREAGIPRNEIYISNVVKYRPVKRSARSLRNRTPSGAEIRAALPALEEEVALLNPSVIATLGNTPLSALLALAGERSISIGACHGSVRNLCVTGRELRLFPLYHPASGIYDRSLIEVMRADARRLGEHLVKERR